MIEVDARRLHPGPGGRHRGARSTSTARSLGLPRNEHLDHEDWVEYEASNVTLAVMTPETHDDEFAAAPARRRSRSACPDVAAAKAELEAKGLEVGEMWDSGVCRGAGFSDPAGTGSSSTTGTSRMSEV